MDPGEPDGRRLHRERDSAEKCERGQNDDRERNARATELSPILAVGEPRDGKTPWTRTWPKSQEPAKKATATSSGAAIPSA